MKTKPNKMNVRLLRRIQKQILKEPRQFQMLELFTTRISDSVTIPNCGTAACIWGHGIALAKRMNPRRAHQATQGFGIDSQPMLELFGLTDTQSDRLFLFYSWPPKFQKIQDDKEGTRAFARQAVRRIDHFIKTRGAE